jgi:hypothetical protein
MTVTAAVTADAGDVPTLPEWAAMLLGALLLLGIARQNRRAG